MVKFSTSLTATIHSLKNILYIDVRCMRVLVMQSQPERWRKISVIDAPYEASTLGRIRRLSIASEAVRKIHPRRNYEPRIITPVVNNGYRYVTLCLKGATKRMSVHAIVLSTFVGPRPDGFYGCHNNGNKADNRIENLRWDSPKSNQLDRVAHGNGQEGEKNGSVKLSDAQVVEILRLRKTGIPYYKIAALVP